LFAWLPAVHAAVCNPNDFQGTYGFLLTGETSIGAAPRPAATIGRLALDGSGQLSGVSSVAFTGIILGNPVTGAYEAHDNCSVVWTLQDDSGASQHFRGTMSNDGKRITFRQSDPGGASDGIMLREAGDCSANGFQGRYALAVSGSTVDVDTARVSGPVSTNGFVDVDSAGGLSFSRDAAVPPVTAGTYEFADGCFLNLAFKLPADGDEEFVSNFRAILVNGGKEVLGIQTDPGTTVSLRMMR
jgi:hypothetical protein